MQVYIKAKSKKEVNEKLTNGLEVTAIEYNLFNTNYYQLTELPTGTVVKIFDKVVGGSPYAKSYGTYNKEKNKVM